MVSSPSSTPTDADAADDRRRPQDQGRQRPVRIEEVPVGDRGGQDRQRLATGREAVQHGHRLRGEPPRRLGVAAGEPAEQAGAAQPVDPWRQRGPALGRLLGGGQRGRPGGLGGLARGGPVDDGAAERLDRGGEVGGEPAAPHHRVDRRERDVQRGAPAGGSAEQTGDGPALRLGRRIERHDPLEREPTLQPRADAVDEPAQIVAAEQPAEPRPVQVVGSAGHHSGSMPCGRSSSPLSSRPSPGRHARGVASTRDRARPSHSQRVMWMASMPSRRLSWWIARPGTVG